MSAPTRASARHSAGAAAAAVRSAAADLPSRFREVRRQTERLCEPLSAEDCQVQSMPDASPVKWHLAHTTWFFETFVLEPCVDDYAPVHPAFRVLFNSYYQSVGEQYPRPRRGMLTRPSLAEVRAYRRHIDRQMGDLLKRGPLESGVAAVVELGLHHEQQHQELILTDIKHALSENPLAPVYAAGAPGPEGAVAAPAPLRWHAYDGGIFCIGHEPESGFSFDNETPRHRVLLEPFDLASRPVTNGEFIDFMESGGYRRPELWLSDAWVALQARGWDCPFYWRRQGGGWSVYTLSGLRPVSACEPLCHVSYYEADAYARWAEARLPSEAEWEVAAAPVPIAGNFVDSGAFHPRADVGNGNVPAQIYGDVWEWTRTPYTAYPGYRPPAGALGEYNGKFMCNQVVLRGGSCATPRSHMRASYRNFFPPEARWQFSGIRLARDGSPRARRVNAASRP